MARVALAGLALATSATALFNAPPGVDIWCGNAYRPTNASFEPGGWLEESPLSDEPLLNVQTYPRMNLYTEDDQFASFIVDAAPSYTNGDLFYNVTFDKSTNATATLSHLDIDISVTVIGLGLVSNGNVSINTTGNGFSFALSELAA